MKSIIVAAVMVAGLTGPALAQDRGTVRWVGADLDCFKVRVQESGINYAVDYALTGTETAMGWINMFSDGFNTVMTIDTDGTLAKDCGDGTYYRITGVSP